MENGWKMEAGFITLGYCCRGEARLASRWLNFQIARDGSKSTIGIITQGFWGGIIAPNHASSFGYEAWTV